MAQKRPRNSAITKNDECILFSEAGRLIINIFHYLKQEYRFMKDHNDAHCDLTPLKNIHKRTCEATGASRKTLHHLLRSEKEESKATGLTGPSYCKQNRPHQLEINCRTGHSIRFIMHNLIQEIIQRDNGKAPTWESLAKTFKETIGYEGSVTLLRRLLCSMGYIWAQENCDIISVVEKHDIRMQKYRYLTNVNKFREKNMNIVYTGASLIYREKQSGLSYTLLGAGTQDGCLPNTFIIHRAPALHDHKYNINYDKYSNWLTENLLPNLPKNSVVVVDDVDYNKKQCGIPDEKEQLKDWLRMHNIRFEDDLHKIELLDIVMKNKDKFIAFKSDELISKQGHIVLRLPPIHPELNAIEGVFEKVKTDINQLSEEDISSSDSHMAMVTSIIEKIRSDPEIWEESCEAVKIIEMEYLGYSGSDTKMNIHIHDDDDDYEDEQGQEPFDSNTSDSDSYESNSDEEYVVIFH